MNIDNIDVPADTEQQALPVVGGKSKQSYLFTQYFLFTSWKIRFSKYFPMKRKGSLTLKISYAQEMSLLLSLSRHWQNFD